MGYQGQNSPQWKTRDFSHLAETFELGTRRARSNIPGSAVLYIIVCLFAFPLGLIGIVSLYGVRRGRVRLSFFKGLHFTLIALLMSPVLLIPLAGTSILAQPSYWQTAGAMSMASLLVLGLMSLGVKALRDSPLPSTTAKIAEDDAVPQHLVSNKIFGIPGNLSTARGKFSDENIEKGEAGEKRTADLLQELLLIPGTRIFHGVRWPGSKDGDIDHVAINGNKIALIDSKLWSGNKHMMTSQGHVITFKGQNESFSRHVHFGNAVRKLEESLMYSGFRGASCYGWLAIHSNNGGKVTVDNKYNPGIPLRLSPANDMVTEIGDWFAQGVDGVVYVELMEEMIGRLK